MKTDLQKSKNAESFTRERFDELTKEYWDLTKFINFNRPLHQSYKSLKAAPSKDIIPMLLDRIQNDNPVEHYLYRLFASHTKTLVTSDKRQLKPNALKWAKENGYLKEEEDEN